MLIQTPQSGAPTASNNVSKKKRLVVILPADMVDNLKEMSQRTGLPVSLIVTIALANVVNLQIPRYAKPRGKKKT